MLHSACALCGQPAAAAVNLGPLLGPIRDGKNPSADELWVHRLCALWSSEVFETEHGTLRNVLAAIKRGRLMKCSHCGRRGATLGCRVPSCNCSYHVACAKDAGCTYYCEQFQVACPEHAPGFKAEARQQIRRTPFTPYRQAAAAAEEHLSHAAGGGTAAERGPGSTAEAAGGAGRAAEMTPAGAEEPPDFVSPGELPTFVGRARGRRQAAMRQHMLEAQAAIRKARRELGQRRKREAESSDDDEHFQNKEARRLARDTAKLNPITLMGDGTAVQHVYVKSPAPGKGGRGDQGPAASARTGGQQLRPPQAQQQPTVETAVVGSIAATDFSSVAGLDDVVRQLREMVLLPMQYPALFEGMGIRPPRGILFHGEPGTGKTLAARALAGACAKHSPVPVTFFARKGADCLGKFHGEAERTLRLLFEEASRRAPAIVFLDELDALVPARAARAGGSDQIYASVVSTLLSLMDGVTDRGSVIVIGATNRPEAIDPALRRPGRFDREVYFGLPTPAQRLAILRVHTHRWSQPPSDQLLQHVAAGAEGYAGADLQALCTAAVMAAVRRSTPLLLEQAEREAAAGGAAAGAEEGRLQAGQQAEQQQGQQEQAERRQQLLDRIEVLECDWREALAAAPPPCSRRPGLSALSAESAASLQPHALPLLASPLRRLLAAMHASDLPLPAPAAAAAALAAAGPAGAQEQAEAGPEQQAAALAALEAVLREHGALLPSPGAAGDSLAAAGSVAGQAGAQLAGRKQKDEEQRLLRAGASYAPCRLLLWGEGEQGQETAAGAVLKLLDGCPVHCLSLPSLVVEGGDDVAAGCAALVTEALRRASPHVPCVFYLPRLESWALFKSLMRPEEALQAGWCCPLPTNGSSPGAKSEGHSGADAQPSSARRWGLHSPSFAKQGSSPMGASPGHRGFPLAPSPFSGLLPLEERVGHTPAVARALRSVSQRHRRLDGTAPSPRGFASKAAGWDEGPTLGDLQRRASTAEPSTAGRPPRPPGAAASAGAALAPLPVLPPIRTSPEQPQQAGQQAEAALPARPGLRPGLGSGAQEEEEEEEEGEAEVEVEVVSLAPAWNVFESLMRQVPSTQPVILLATCHAAPDATPANIVRFFAGPAGASSSGLAGAGADVAFDAAEVAAPGVVRMAQPGAVAWGQAAASAAQQVAASVAWRAALQLHQQLVAAGADAEAAAEAPAAGEAGEAGVQSPGPAATSAGIQLSPQQQQQPEPEPRAVRGASPGRRQPQQLQQAAVGQAGQPEQCNTAELEQGLRLFDRLLSWQVQMGGALARERVGPLHRWALSSGRRRAGAPAAGPPTFAQLAERCQLGACDSPDALQAEAAAAAAHVLALAEEEAQRAEREQQRGRGRQQGMASPDRGREAQSMVTAACSLQDKIDTACFAVRQELQLGEPANARLLAAAAAHVRRLQREAERQAREAAVAEEAARRKRAREAAAEEEEAEQMQMEEAEAAAKEEAAEGTAGGRLAAGEEDAEGVEEQQQQEQEKGQGQRQEGQEPSAKRQRRHPLREWVQAAFDDEEGPGDGDRPQQHKACRVEGLLERPAEVAVPAEAGAAAPDLDAGEEGAEQQGQQHCAAASAAPAADGQEADSARALHEQRAEEASRLLAARLRELLLTAVQRRLPALPAAGCSTAWQALQDWASKVGAEAAAACCQTVEATAGAGEESGMEEEAVQELAARCVAAFEEAK